MMIPQMDCQTYRAHLDEWLDGELPQELLPAMEAHRNSCPECAEETRLAFEARRMLAELGDEIPVPLEAQAAWRRAVREEIRADKTRRWNRLMRGVGSVAAALAVLVGCTFAFRSVGLLDRRMNAVPLSAPMISEDAVGRMSSASLGYAQDTAAVGQMSLTYIASDGSEEVVEVASAPEAADEAAFSTDALEDAALLIEDSAEIAEQPAAAVETESMAEPAAASSTPAPTLAPAGEKSAEAANAAGEGALLIRSAQRTIITENYDADAQSIRDLSEQYGGYLEKDAVSMLTDGLRVGEMTCVLPAMEADSFLQAVDHIGSVSYTAERFEDATLSLRDASERLEALEAERARLTELIAGAQTAEELSRLDGLMQTTLAAIDELQADNSRLNSELMHVRVSIRLEELYVAVTAMPTAVPALAQRMSTAFSESASSLKLFVHDMAVSLMIIAPFALAVLGVAAVIAVIALAVRRARRGRKDEDR